VKRITTGIIRTGVDIKIMPGDMVVTPAPGPTTTTTDSPTAADTVPSVAVSTMDTATVLVEVVRTDTDTVPAEVVLTITDTMDTLHLHLSTILLHLLFTLHLLASHKKIATKSVLLVVPPVVAEVEKEERVATTVASAVHTEASVARVGKVEKEEAVVVSITDMHPVKQSVNLLWVTTNLTHRTDRFISVRTMIAVGIASLF